MDKTKPGSPGQQSLRSRVRTLLAARLAVVSFLMGMVVFVQSEYDTLGPSLPALFPVAIAYILSIIYALGLKFVVNFTRFSAIQLIVDLALVSSILFFTGGLNSPFSFLYIFVIFATPFLLGQKAIYMIASAASGLYVSLLSLEYYGLLHPYYVFPPVYDSTVGGYILTKGIINVASFYLVALLSGAFASLLEKKERELEKTSEDFTLLKAFHQNVLDHMGSGVLAVDNHGTVLSHNPAVESILSISDGIINKRDLSKLLKLPRLKYLFTHINQLNPQSSNFSWTRVNNDGKEIALTMTLNQYVVDNVVMGAIVVLHDVSYIKDMEKQMADSERLAAIGRVAAGIAHEIRNPLASLSGSIQMLSSDLNSAATADDRKLMDIVLRESSRLNRIISQFLSYASPSKMELAAVNIGELLNETITLLKANPDYQAKASFVVDIEPELNAFADQEQIRQIVWNLCVNALEAMEKDGELKVNAKKDDRGKDRRRRTRSEQDESGDMPQNHIRITISDNGKGIDPAELDKIFEPFYTNKPTGTGLGLSTVYKIVHSHNGNISVDSSPNVGTSVSVWLPMEHVYGDANAVDSNDAHAVDKPVAG